MFENVFGLLSPNSITEPDAYLLICIDDTLDFLGGKVYLSGLKHITGCRQLEMGTRLCFLLLRCPEHLTATPSCFERLMEQMKRDVRWKTLLVYLIVF